MEGVREALADNQLDFFRSECTALLAWYRKEEDWPSVSALGTILSGLDSADGLKDKIESLPKDLAHAVNTILAELPDPKVEDTVVTQHLSEEAQPTSEVSLDGEKSEGRDFEESGDPDPEELVTPETDEESPDEWADEDSDGDQETESGTVAHQTLEEVYESLGISDNPPPAFQPELTPPRKASPKNYWGVTRNGFQYPLNCPRCLDGENKMVPERDWYGDSATCMSCGYVYEHMTSPPIELLEEEESGHRQRRRQPSHGKIRL